MNVLVLFVNLLIKIKTSKMVAIDEREELVISWKEDLRKCGSRPASNIFNV